jgi:hypothetical protein
MQSLVTFLKMLLALALAGMGGMLLAGGVAGGSKEFSVSLGIFLLAASQLALLAWFWR